MNNSSNHDFVSSYQGQADYRDPTGKRCGGHRYSYTSSLGGLIGGGPSTIEKMLLVGAVTCRDMAVNAETTEAFPGCGVIDLVETGTTHAIQTRRGPIEVKDREWVVRKRPQQVLTADGAIVGRHDFEEYQEMAARCGLKPLVEAAGPVLFPAEPMVKR